MTFFSRANFSIFYTGNSKKLTCYFKGYTFFTQENVRAVEMFLDIDYFCQQHTCGKMQKYTCGTWWGQPLVTLTKTSGTFGKAPIIQTSASMTKHHSLMDDNIRKATEGKPKKISCQCHWPLFFGFWVWNFNMGLKAFHGLFSDFSRVKFAFHALFFLFLVFSSPLFCSRHFFIDFPVI